MRILIIEDDYLISSMIEEVLRDCGHEVVGIAASVAEARTIAASTVPDVALTDVFLRDGQSSSAVSQELADAGVFIVFATGNPGELTADRQWAIGCIHKPFGRQTLVAALDLLQGLRRGKPLPSNSPAGIELYGRPAAT